MIWIRDLLVLALFQSFFCASLSIADTAADLEAKHGDHLKLIFYDNTDFALAYNLQPSKKGNHLKADADYQDLNAELDFGLPLSQDTGVIANVIYDKKTFKFNQDLPENRSLIESDVHSLRLQTALGTFFNDDFGAALIFEPSIDSDFEHLSGKDLQFSYGALGSYRPYKNLQLAFQAGLFYVDSHYRSYAYPVVGFTYQSENQWRVHLAAPVYLRVGYFLTPKSELFSMLTYSQDDYHALLGDADIDSDIRASSSQLGFGVATYVFPKLMLTLKSGISFQTHYRLIPDNGPEFRGNLDTALFLHAELGLVF